MVYIYILQDPNSFEIRYVGKTSNINRRKSERKSRAGKRQSHCLNWVAKLQRFNQTPVFKVIQEVPENCWEKAEVFWIDYFKKLGCPLTNINSGGNGADSGEKHPWYGQHHTEKTCNLISEVQKKSWKDNDKRKKELSERTKKLWRDPVFRKNMRERLRGNCYRKGNKLTDKHKKVLSESMREKSIYRCSNCQKVFNNRASFGGHRAHCVGNASERLREHHKNNNVSKEVAAKISAYATKKQMKVCPRCDTEWNTHAAYAGHRSHCKKG